MMITFFVVVVEFFILFIFDVVRASLQQNLYSKLVLIIEYDRHLTIEKTQRIALQMHL